MTAPSYAACGKQVLRDGQDFAQACSAEAALLIVIALGAARRPRLSRDELARAILAGMWGDELAGLYWRTGDVRKGDAFRAADALLTILYPAKEPVVG